MGVFSRLTDIINANLNSMLDKAEDPEKVLRLIIQEMEETLVEVRSSAAKNLADKKSLLRQQRSLESRVQFWHEKAEKAVDKGRDDLARAALVEKQSCQAKSDQFHKDLDVIEENLLLIQEDSQRLQEKLTEAKRKRESMKVRQESAVVRLKVRQKLDSHDIESAINKYEQYQQKIDDMEAKIEAYDITKPTSLAKEIDALEENEAVENELASMKKQVVNG